VDARQIEELCHIVGDQLGHPAQIILRDDPESACAGYLNAPSFSQQCLQELAAVENRRWAIRPGNKGQCWVTLQLSERTGLGWQTHADEAEMSAKLAMVTVDHFLLERMQLGQTQEIDSLTEQVMDDFEELALLRSLAESLPLLQEDESPEQIAKRFIDPLALGLGAESLVAILAEGSSETNESKRPGIQKLVWNDAPFVDPAALESLLDQQAETAKRQPVVQNHLELPTQINGQLIREMILIECRSETHLHGWLCAFNRIENQAADQQWAQHGFTTVQASLMQTATNQLAAQLHNAKLFRQKENLFTDVVRALVNAVEARDPYTCGHSERVASFARCLTQLSGRSLSDCDRIFLTGLLHDVGKIAIPDGVLQKPGHLDERERAIIETHTDAGWRILHELDALKSVLPGVLYHHEHYNGKGYPDGLAGEEIPWEGRVLAVCDAFDAMTSDRPYRDGMPIKKACEILRGGSGTYWDPTLIDLFVDSIDQIDAIRIAHKPRAAAVREKPGTNAPSFAAAD